MGPKQWATALVPATVAALALTGCIVQQENKRIDAENTAAEAQAEEDAEREDAKARMVQEVTDECAEAADHFISSRRETLPDIADMSSSDVGEAHLAMELRRRAQLVEGCVAAAFPTTNEEHKRMIECTIEDFGVQVTCVVDDWVIVPDRTFKPDPIDVPEEYFE